MDETEYWLELISDAEYIKPELLIDLKKETKELLAITTQSIITKRKSMVRNVQKSNNSEEGK